MNKLLFMKGNVAHGLSSQCHKIALASWWGLSQHARIWNVFPNGVLTYSLRLLFIHFYIWKGQLRWLCLISFIDECLGAVKGRWCVKQWISNRGAVVGSSATHPVSLLCLQEPFALLSYCVSLSYFYLNWHVIIYIFMMYSTRIQIMHTVCDGQVRVISFLHP